MSKLEDGFLGKKHLLFPLSDAEERSKVAAEMVSGSVTEINEKALGFALLSCLSALQGF